MKTRQCLGHKQPSNRNTHSRASLIDEASTVGAEQKIVRNGFIQYQWLLWQQHNHLSTGRITSKQRTSSRKSRRSFWHCRWRNVSLNESRKLYLVSIFFCSLELCYMYMPLRPHAKTTCVSFFTFSGSFATIIKAKNMRLTSLLIISNLNIDALMCIVLLY